MTEREWLISENPAGMLAYLSVGSPVRHQSASDRKLRLWIEACREVADRANTFWSNLSDATNLGRMVREWSRPEAWTVTCPLPLRAHLLREVVGNPHRPVTLCGMARKPFHNQYAHVNKAGGFWLEAECPACTELRTPTVLEMAQHAYEGDWLTLIPLSDALEEAGCDDTELLGHLRNSQLHVKGCWAIDLILGND